MKLVSKNIKIELEHFSNVPTYLYLYVFNRLRLNTNRITHEY